jgi:hypothetical protein
MGLDITAHAAVLLTEEHELTDECWDKGHVHIGETPFEHALGSLLPGRCYSTAGESLEFRAGSYSGYNIFRERLSQAALGVAPIALWNDPDSYRFRAFFELINFSDCEGQLGPEVCAKLARDFAEQRERVRPRLLDADEFHDYYGEKYDDWHAAFRLAAGTGVVVFH